MPRASTFVLLNPAAGRGRGARRGREFLSLLERHVGPVDHAVSERPGHEGDLLDRALAEDYRSIVAVGGDGTWSAAADRIVRSARRDVTLGLLPAGTGNDFGKSLGIRYARAEEVARAIAEGREQVVDVGRVGGRYFLNVVGIGFDIAVIDDAASTPLLKGDLLYRFCALRQLFRFPGIPVALAADDGTTLRRRYLMLVIANGNYFGGSFHIAPSASLDDGMLDAVSIFDAPPLARARLFSLVAKGRHEGAARVDVRKGRRFTVSVEGVEAIRYEVDGELCTSDGPRLEVETVPRALRVYAP
jgi:diacylglycerol kinase (ATP)